MKDFNEDELSFFNELPKEQIPQLSAGVKTKLDRKLFPVTSKAGFWAVAAAVLIIVAGAWFFFGKSASEPKQEPLVVKPITPAPLDVPGVVDTPSAPVRIQQHVIAKKTFRKPAAIDTDSSAAARVTQPQIIAVSTALNDHPGILENCPEIF